MTSISRRASALGDAIEVFHSLPDEGPDASEPEVLFAALTLNGVSKRFYRFRTPDDGVVDYYDEEGKSAKKFLMRKPMTTGVLRSGFGMRRHPILKYTPHAYRRRLRRAAQHADPCRRQRRRREDRPRIPATAT